MIVRRKLTERALAEWRKLRDPITDQDELDRIYAELTGWIASRDPIMLAEFIQHQRQYRRRPAALKQ